MGVQDIYSTALKVSYDWGYHVYKQIWIPCVGEELGLIQEGNNPYDRYAVVVQRAVDNETVGWVPKELSQVFWKFIDGGN